MRESRLRVKAWSISSGLKREWHILEGDKEGSSSPILGTKRMFCKNWRMVKKIDRRLKWVKRRGSDTARTNSVCFLKLISAVEEWSIITQPIGVGSSYKINHQLRYILSLIKSFLKSKRWNCQFTFFFLCVWIYAN